YCACLRPCRGTVIAPRRRARFRQTLLGDVFERFDLAVHGELLERTRLDLPHPLARDPELPPDRVERRRVAVAVQPVAQLQDLLLAVRQVRQRLLQHLLLEADVELLLRRRLVAREHVTERAAFVLLADRPVEARHRPGGGAHFTHLLQRQLRVLRAPLLRPPPSELRRQLALRAADALLALGDVHRDPDRPRLVRHSALYRLADPPGRVRRELEAAPPVELLDRPDQPDDPFLDQVEQREPVPLVALRDRDDKPAVGVDHPLLRLLVGALDPLRDPDLLLRRRQRPAAGRVGG